MNKTQYSPGTYEQQQRRWHISCKDYKTQYSPLPWRIAGQFVNSDGPTVADCGCSSIITHEEIKANQAFIVRACNSYPYAQRLADTLKDVRDNVKSDSPDMWQRAGEALAQWEKANQ